MKTKQLKVVAAGLISMLALGMGTPVFATAQSRPGVDVAYSTLHTK